MFVSDLLAHAREHATKSMPAIAFDKEELDLLVGNEAFAIAEFYYLASKHGLNDRRRMRDYLLRHNEYLEELIRDKDKRDELGKTVSRLKEGIFTDQAIAKVVQHISEGKIYLDQADLGRALTPMFSAETTRKAVIALAKGGLLDRFRIGQVLVASNGTLERYFEKHLSSIVRDIKQAVLQSTEEQVG
jgi:hypothetical protein